MGLLLVRDLKEPECNVGKLSFATPAEDFFCTTPSSGRGYRPRCAAGGLKSRSCVQPGLYRLERHHTEAHPRTRAPVNPELDVVHFADDNDERLRVCAMIHVANYAREVRAYIGVGFRRARDERGYRMVSSSKRAMIELKRLLPWDDSHTLEIR